MMNSQQQLQFPISEDAAYFLPAGQYYPQYVSLAQQFPVVYPDWSSAYGEPYYYPTQAQYLSSGPTTPIILSSALQQQAPPPQYALPQQFPVANEPTGFYYGTYLDWSSAYGEPYYYPTQAQYLSSGPTTPIILSSALQQQAPPPQYALPQQFPVANEPMGFYYGTYADWSSAYGVPYYPTQDQYQSSGPIILSSALQQQAPPPQYALPQQRRRECQQTVVAVQTDDESTPPTATVVIPPAAASTPPPPSKVPELVVPSKLTTEPNLSQGLQLASPLSTVPVGQDSDFGASASPPPPLTDLPPADIPALEPKMGESMDAPLVSEAVPQAEKEPVEAPLEPEPPVSRSSQCQRKSPRKIITSVSFSNDIQLNKAEKAWRPSMKKVRAHKAEADEENLEVAKTLDLLRRVRSILNKLTPQMFQPLMKQLTELSMDTEERLKGVVDLVYEKAISEPKFSVTYAKLCRCLMMLKVPTSDKSGGTVNFGRLLLNCCQKEFAKDKDSNERKQKELEAASEDEERQRLIEELDAMKDEARHRSLGNIKFIGELFKVEMLSELILHDCIVKLLQKSHSEERLECLCILLSTIGKDIEKAKPKMDHYCSYISKIINARKTSLRIRCKLQDVLDLRQNNWVPRRGDQGPKTIVEIHKEANLEEQREQIKVPEQLLSKKDSSRACWSRRGPPVRRPHHPTSGRCLEFGAHHYQDQGPGGSFKRLK